MPREATLFESTGGNLFLAYLALREEGVNIPANWIKRSHVTRKNREKELAKELKLGKLDAANLIRAWDVAYRKECFYRGLRALLEIEREGTTKLWIPLSKMSGKGFVSNTSPCSPICEASWASAFWDTFPLDGRDQRESVARRARAATSGPVHN
jgi:hypothetical protein